MEASCSLQSELITYQKTRDNGDVKLQAGLQQPSPPPPPPTMMAPPPSVAVSPPSASSSPSHEFSFTISLHPSSSATTTTTPPDRTKTPSSSSFAVDLSPADEIFFHGHLLPLHLLSNLPVSSPRSSTNSMDSFTLPIKELQENRAICNNNINNTEENFSENQEHNGFYHDHETKRRSKPKSFSLFGIPKWRKGCEIQEKEGENHKRKLKFDVSHVLKRYIRMVTPFLSFRNRRTNMDFQRKPQSYSGNLSFRRKNDLRGRRGEYSAPASIWTSPTNSGHLVATTGNIPTSTSDSTMEELQAAIQAAIAHCKNSIATEEQK